MLVSRTMELKIRGYNAIEISKALKEEFNLVEEPNPSTVNTWICTAVAEEQDKIAETTTAYIMTHHRRAEAIIKRLIPFALDPFCVRRKAIRDGCEVDVIDEDTIKEQIAAAAEIRKQGESVLKALGVYRPVYGPHGEAGSAPESLKMFVLQAVTNHIAKDGQVLSEEKRATVLELCAGDEVIDSM